MLTGRKHSFQPGLECLEERTLLAAHLSASLTGGLLRIEGTAGADTIVVREIHNQISVDGVRISRAGHPSESSVSAAAVARIEVFGEGGNDRIFLNSDAVRGQQALSKPVSVWGGSGNDLIVAGAGPETIYGGDGNDTIYGGAGNDRIYGEGGDDRISAGSGNTLVDGGPGHNLMVGGRGNDVFFSHSAQDVLTPGSGHTVIHRDYVVPMPTRPASVVHGLDFSSTPAPAPFQQQIDQIIALENAYRADQGLNTLTINSKLMAAARYQADYMARTGHYDHINLDGRGLGDRVEAAGYSFTWVGENIHLYVPSIARTTGLSQYFPPSQLAQYYFEGWQVSPEHNTILLSPHALQVGLAISQAANGNIYAAMVFGHP